MTSSQHGPDAWGHTHATMGGTGGRHRATGRQSVKAPPSSDRRLQLACVKLESLVMVYQNDTVNTFPGLVHTARHVT